MRPFAIALMIVGLSSVQVFSTEELFDVQSADEYFNKGLNIYYMKDYTAAIQEFTEAIRINPQNAKAYYFIGYAYYKQGNFSKATEAFEMAYELKLDYSPTSQFTVNPG
jgi:tetratricopeptide (TPR) repeat protein